MHGEACAEEVLAWAISGNTWAYDEGGLDGIYSGWCAWGQICSRVTIFVLLYTVSTTYCY